MLFHIAYSHYLKECRLYQSLVSFLGFCFYQRAFRYAGVIKMSLPSLVMPLFSPCLNFCYSCSVQIISAFVGQGLVNYILMEVIYYFHFDSYARPSSLVRYRDRISGNLSCLSSVFSMANHVFTIQIKIIWFRSCFL